MRCVRDGRVLCFCTCSLPARRCEQGVAGLGSRERSCRHPSLSSPNFKAQGVLSEDHPLPAQLKSALGGRVMEEQSRVFRHFVFSGVLRLAPSWRGALEGRTGPRSCRLLARRSGVWELGSTIHPVCPHLQGLRLNFFHVSGYFLKFFRVRDRS